MMMMMMVEEYRSLYRGLRSLNAYFHFDVFVTRIVVVEMVNALNRVRTLFGTKNSRTFQGHFRPQLPVFSVTPFKIDQNKKSKPFNRLSPEPENRKKADIQRLSPRFRSQQFFLWKRWGETFSPNL